MIAHVFAVASLAVAASAAAAGKLIRDVQEQQCGNGNKISCCNTEAGDSQSGLLSNILNGLNCVDVPVIAVPVLNQCSGSNVAACCPAGNDNDNLINISCFPITL